MALLSEIEKQQRSRAVASSEGSLAMEGQALDPTTADLSRRYAEGELTLEQFGSLIEQHAASLVEQYQQTQRVASAA